MEEQKKMSPGIIISLVLVGICAIAGIVGIVIFCLNDTSLGKIDENALESLMGRYEPVGDKEYLGLTINKSQFACIDVAAGNPGVEGKLFSVSSSEIVVDVEMDYFEEMPDDHWELDGNNRLVMSYELVSDGIYLTNSGRTVYFRRVR